MSCNPLADLMPTAGGQLRIPVSEAPAFAGGQAQRKEVPQGLSWVEGAEPDRPKKRAKTGSASGAAKVGRPAHQEKQSGRSQEWPVPYAPLRCSWPSSVLLDALEALAQSAHCDLAALARCLSWSVETAGAAECNTVLQSWQLGVNPQKLAAAGKQLLPLARSAACKTTSPGTTDALSRLLFSCSNSWCNASLAGCSEDSQRG